MIKKLPHKYRRRKYNKKKSKIYFDGKVDLGNILTILLILIGAIALMTQIRSTQLAEKELSIKVDEINKILSTLDQEKLERQQLEIEQIQLETRRINAESYNFRFLLDLIEDSDNLNIGYITSLIMNTSDIAELLLTKNFKISRPEKELLESIINMNFSRIQIILAGEKYNKALNDFIAEHNPDKNSKSTDQSNNLIVKGYIDSLNIFIGNIKAVLEEDLKKPKEQLRIHSDKYIKAKDEIIKTNYSSNLK